MELRTRSHRSAYRRIVVCLQVAALLTLLPGCTHKGTFEEYSEQTKCFEKTETAFPGLQVKVDGNTITYSYDISEVVEKLKPDEKVLEKIKITLKARLEASEETYSENCRNFENESGVQGLELTVNYTYNGKILVGRTYTSAGVAKAADSSGAAAATGNTKPKQE